MSKLFLSAFSDEYADGLQEQCQALNGFGIENMEMRGVNGKNVSTLTKEEVKEAKKILAELRRRAPEALRLTREKLRVFRKECGSYSYCPTHSATRSQGCPAAVADAWEGDINATIICSSDILNYIYAALDLYEYRVPIFSSADAKRFYELIEAK